MTVQAMPISRAAVRGPREGFPPPAADWCLFLDIDGTLLEHRDRPDDVVVDAAQTRMRQRVLRRTAA